MKKRWKIVLVILCVLMMGTVLIGIYGVTKVSKETKKLQVTKEYKRHFVLIADKPDSVFWKNVYQSGAKEAKKNGALLEIMGKNMSSDYSIAEYMDMAIAMGVDGIIVNPDGSAEVRKKIDEAQQKKIPVITVMNDESASKRSSYVGINTYQLGDLYAQEIRKKMNILHKDEVKVNVLYDTESHSQAEGMIFNQLKGALNALHPGVKNVVVEPYSVAKENVFEKEEAIRKIFVGNDNVPDVLVCMDETETEYAYQAVIDYNYVGRVFVVGYYRSESILDAIEKGIITATLEPDAKQTGKNCVEPLIEYYDTGYVNSYYSIDCDFITSDNVAKYRKEEKK